MVTLLKRPCGLDQFGELVGLFTAIANVFAVKIRNLDVEEVLGLADRGLLVRSLEALGIGPALDEAADLPIPAGVGLEDAQFRGVVGDGRDRRQYGQCAVP